VAVTLAVSATWHFRREIIFIEIVGYNLNPEKGYLFIISDLHTLFSEAFSPVKRQRRSLFFAIFLNIYPQVMVGRKRLVLPLISNFCLLRRDHV